MIFKALFSDGKNVLYFALENIPAVVSLISLYIDVQFNKIRFW